MLSPFYPVLWPVKSYLICFAEVGLCLLKKSGMTCAFPVWELFTSVDVEAENERSVFVMSAATFQGWLLVGAGRFSSAQSSVLITWYRNYSLAV